MFSQFNPFTLSFNHKQSNDMKKLLKIYGVYCTCEFGIGLQYVKANDAKDARVRFKKRFKRRILSVERIKEPNCMQTQGAIY